MPQSISAEASRPEQRQRAAAARDPNGVGAADPLRGREALHQYGCHGCHVIPGITGPDVHVGPPLAGIGSRRLIAGLLPNEPAQMVRWLLDPPGVDPKTAMPALEVAEADARDMAAYLATLRHD